MKTRTIREAKPVDIPEIMQVMEAAKKIMRSSGNMHQWGDGYPSEAVITNDMDKHGGFVIEDAGRIVGYFAFLMRTSASIPTRTTLSCSTTSRSTALLIVASSTSPLVTKG